MKETEKKGLFVNTQIGKKWQNPSWNKESRITDRDFDKQMVGVRLGLWFYSEIKHVTINKGFISYNIQRGL